MLKENQNIILFDGVCNLCEASVQFIIKHDNKNYFYFTSQSSALGKKLLKKYDLDQVDSIALLQNNKAYTHSDAGLEIARHLDGWYKYLYVFRFVPRILRDGLYKLVAKYRYKVFGKKEHCMMPNEALKSRFLD
ncbi:MAG: Thiol-disulfide oxidoreductase [uncultured Sulfurovum sp.]|uniref:Thiol-disulfide oxidoreductase n=1 Tax=uncultured Sulfurovum sp. TaxID=269237 RepID=A0A6S6U244_9BACT|nr:MAG: Thiol-disulfide oxidoreductase [uncultured Sulfurovum sp.]